MTNEETAVKATYFSIAGNTSLAIIKGLAGYFGNSFALIADAISYRFVIKKSKDTNSSSLKADALHHRSDAITSVAAFIGISIALIFGNGYKTTDDWAALFASGFIFTTVI